MTQNNAILGIGAIMIDQMLLVPRVPASGEGVVVQEHFTSMGGCAFNSANAIRQLGGTCFLFAPLGTGPVSDAARRELDARGMSALEVSTTLDNATCLCLIEDNGERTMITLPGIERCYESSWFELIDANDYTYAFIGGYEIEGAGGSVIIDFLEKHPHLQIFYNPGPMITRIGSEKNSRINALNPIWHINELEALSYTGCASVSEAGSIIAEQSGTAVVITAGEAGAYLISADGSADSCNLIPGKPASVVDTVGAGDAHLGAMVAAISMGSSLEASIALANDMAAAVCQTSGSTLSDDEFLLSSVSVTRALDVL